MTKRIIPQKEKELDVLCYMHSLSQDIVSIPEITTVSEWNAYWLKNHCGSIKRQKRNLNQSSTETIESTPN